MHILYDHQVFSLETMGGMTKYYAELIQWLQQQGHQVSLPIWLSNNFYLKTDLSDWFPTKSLFPSKKIKGKQNLLYRYNKFTFLHHIDRYLSGVDVVHLTLYDPYLIKILKHKMIPFVFNVYDLNHKTQQLKRWLLDIGMCDYADEGTKILWEAANAIICVSKQTKSDLLHYYPTIDPQKIQIIYHSIDVEAVQSICDKEEMPLISGNYLLFIGKRAAEYKNFKPFIRSIAGLLSKDTALICLGHEPFTDEELALFDELGIREFVKYKGGDESVKYNLFKFAQCFVYPSFAEGFGIPILEARVAGCPVVASNISVFMEVWWGAALYFDPKSTDNMKELIGGVMQNKDIQSNLRDLGKQRVKDFDKQVELDKTIKLYETLCFNWEKP